MPEANRRLYSRRDLAAERREMELLRLENLELKRELNLLNAPVMDKPKFESVHTPKVFPDRPLKKKVPVKVEYIYTSGWWPGFVAGLIVGAGVVIAVVIAALVATGTA